MLDVKIGSFFCFAIYALQLFPKILGKKYATWHENHRTIVDEIIIWCTNVFWGYVGIRVLNPGLYGGVLVYLFVLGIVRTISLHKRARELRLQESIKSFQTNFGETRKDPTEIIISLSIPIQQKRIMLPDSSDRHLIPVEVSNVEYKIAMGRQLKVYYWYGGMFYPLQSMNAVELRRDHARKVEGPLKRFEFSKVLDILMPILRDHAARQ